MAEPLFREGLHEISASISREIVGKNFVRGVISDVHAAGNDGIAFSSAARGAQALRAAVVKNTEVEDHYETYVAVAAVSNSLG